MLLPSIRCAGRRRAALAIAAAALLPLGGDAHGTLTQPMSRALRFASNTTRAHAEALAGNCERGACEWYQQDTVIPGETTNCEPAHRTMGVACGSTSPVDYPCTPGRAVPWCAPGTAPVKSPCGVFAGGGPLLPDGRDMLDLTGAPTETWRAGSTQSVGWSMIANHGGGYSFRLCSKARAQTEECFAAGALRFAGATTAIVNASGAAVAQIPAVRLSSGTHPPGSVWTRNPIPLEEGMIPPIPGLPQLSGRGPFPYSVVDRVVVPKGLESGEYTLSWRWDAEQTKQVWSQCADVRVVAEGDHEPLPERDGGGHRAAASPRPVCVGASIGLTMSECTAWVELFDALNGRGWVGQAGTASLAARTDPCGAQWTDWTKSIVCTQTRDYKHISEIYLMGVAPYSGAAAHEIDVRPPPLPVGQPPCPVADGAWRLSGASGSGRAAGIDRRAAVADRPLHREQRRHRPAAAGARPAPLAEDGLAGPQPSARR